MYGRTRCGIKTLPGLIAGLLGELVTEVVGLVIAIIACLKGVVILVVGATNLSVRCSAAGRDTEVTSEYARALVSSSMLLRVEMTVVTSSVT